MLMGTERRATSIYPGLERCPHFVVFGRGLNDALTLLNRDFTDAGL
jgi:hypothetical protein